MKYFIVDPKDRSDLSLHTFEKVLVAQSAPEHLEEAKTEMWSDQEYAVLCANDAAGPLLGIFTDDYADEDDIGLIGYVRPEWANAVIRSLEDS